MPRWNTFSQFLDEANNLSNDVSKRQLVNELLRERPHWPWVEDNHATFIYVEPGAERVAVNLDIINNDPPFLPMEKLEGTTLWYVTERFAPDDLLDYLMVVNDPMTPLRSDPNLVSRIQRYWHADDLNPNRIRSAQTETRSRGRDPCLRGASC